MIAKIKTFVTFDNMVTVAKTATKTALASMVVTVVVLVAINGVNRVADQMINSAVDVLEV